MYVCVTVQAWSLLWHVGPLMILLYKFQKGFAVQGNGKNCPARQDYNGTHNYYIFVRHHIGHISPNHGLAVFVGRWLIGTACSINISWGMNNIYFELRRCWEECVQMPPLPCEYDLDDPELSTMLTTTRKNTTEGSSISTIGIKWDWRTNMAAPPRTCVQQPIPSCYTFFFTASSSHRQLLAFSNTAGHRPSTRDHWGL